MESDEALYREVRQGSKSAFEKLYAKYERPLFSYLLRRLENRQEAEEVFHETMLSLFKGPEAKFQEGAFAGWLFKVALHISLNRLRSRRREKIALVAFKDQESRAYDPGTDAAADPDAIRKLEDSVKDLSAPLRQVYELRAEGKSYEEMAKIAAVPIGTIKSRVNKMVSHLRKEISQWIAK